tara:strand:- start:326 stop:526 length:201 start_codon:yes stop_codon:yes gene_type:complete
MISIFPLSSRTGKGRIVESVPKLPDPDNIVSLNNKQIKIREYPFNLVEIGLIITPGFGLEQGVDKA